jgi:nitroreductase
VFNFARREVRNFLVANAIFWLEEFHVDGLRVDAVASMLYLDYSRREGEWVPNRLGGRENLDAISFLQEVNATCYKRVPGIMMIAEESTAWGGVSQPTSQGGLGFGFKWNMGWMNDTLEYVKLDPIYRQYHHNELTFSLVYAYSENFILPLSHDEVVHGKGSLVGKMPGDEWRRFAGLRTLLGYMWAHPGKQLLFMGGEFGQQSEWSEERGLEWWVLEYGVHSGVQRLVRDMNRVYTSSPALWSQDAAPDGFSWIDANDAAGNVLSFLRYGSPLPGAGLSGPVLPTLACIANFSAMPHTAYRVGLPKPGRWREVLNTDAVTYGGSGVGNLGAVYAVPEPWNGKPASATIAIPPLGVVWLVPDLSFASGSPLGRDCADGRSAGLWSVRLSRMQTWEAIRSRRNVHEFSSQPVADDHLDEILESGRRAPSSRNWQPWDFVVVRDRGKLQRLSRVSPGAGHLATAAAAIALVAPVPATDLQKNRVQFDLGQAAMSLMLAAAGLAIGSGQTGVSDEELARELLGFPSDKFCPYVISLGYPADRPLTLIRRPDRRPLSEIVHREQW